MTVKDTLGKVLRSSALRADLQFNGSQVGLFLNFRKI
jgi:hypothetical protein